ncbi:MAG: PEGA domain-containing protein [Acidimicrobiia bacterium]|nr:PEGA domain-containing protein [Acidimicrobiia bacterium]
MGRTGPFLAVLMLALTRMPSAQQSAGVLKVTSFPSSAQVFVDGVATGKVTPMSIALSLGEHTVTVQIAGGG